jgi:hypothetical protein
VVCVATVAIEDDEQPWGGGKTTVLHLLKRRLDAREDIFCLLVSPWEYDNQTDPTTALCTNPMNASGPSAASGLCCT